MKLLKLILAGQLILGGMGPLVYADNKPMPIVVKVERLFTSECNNGATDWITTNNLKFTDCLQQVMGKLTTQDRFELDKAIPILRSKYSTKQMQELDHFIAQADQNTLMFADVSEFMTNQNKTAISGEVVLGLVMFTLAMAGFAKDYSKNAKSSQLRSSDQIIAEYWAQHPNERPTTPSNYGVYRNEEPDDSDPEGENIDNVVKLEESRTARIRECEKDRNKSLNKNDKKYLELILTNAKICVLEVRGDVSP
jgi:hypothetical protein